MLKLKVRDYRNSAISRVFYLEKFKVHQYDIDTTIQEITEVVRTT